MNIIDSHLHFVDPSRPEGVVWPPVDSPLHRSASPDRLMTLYSGAALSGCVVVETSRRDLDDEWLMATAAKEPLVRGVVLNLRPDDGGFAERFDRALQSDRFVGIRLRPIADYDLSSRRLFDNLKRMAAAGKTVEFGASTAGQKRQFADLAGSLPELRLILDHGGHPPGDNDAGDDAIAKWRGGIRQIAALGNTVCKMTGGGRRVFDGLASAFGTDRLLYGSNWPVYEPTATGMQQRLDTLRGFAGSDAPAFFADNAERVYGLAKAAAAGTSRVCP